jgi:hypothetical protein
MSAFTSDFDVLEECTSKNSGIQVRLIQSHKTKTLAIQSYGFMSGEWITTYRYGDIQSIWAQIKGLVKRLSERSKSVDKSADVV